jgi:hypothetical protein
VFIKVLYDRFEIASGILGVRNDAPGEVFVKTNNIRHCEASETPPWQSQIIVCIG